MSNHYASADGMIIFERELSSKEIFNTQTEFEDCGIYACITPTRNSSDVWVSRVELSSAESLYYRDKIEQVLNEISEMAPIKYVEIEYEDDNKELWRFVYLKGKWVYQKGQVIYEDEEKQV